MSIDISVVLRNLLPACSEPGILRSVLMQIADVPSMLAASYSALGDIMLHGAAILGSDDDLMTHHPVHDYHTSRKAYGAECCKTGLRYHVCLSVCSSTLTYFERIGYFYETWYIQLAA
jgi:hypothetical protein